MGKNPKALLRRKAQVLALQTRRELDIAPGSPVDIYSAIRDLRLWLLFEPLSGLFGMYQRQGDASGIVVNVKVHPALQRYTAAHELGHHILGHQAGVDPERNINSWESLNDQELAAQMFAAEFLMPLQAVNHAAASMGLDQARLDSMSVYQLSLRLRTSYSAMITRLQTLGWLRSSGASALRRVTPKQLKQELLGRAPTHPQSDVWLLTDKEAEASISPQVGDEVLVHLKENPTTGYRWMAIIPDTLEMAGEHFEPNQTTKEVQIGAPGIRHWDVRVAGEGTSEPRFLLQRAWEVEAEPAGSYALRVTSVSRPEPGVDRYQQTALLAV